MATSREQSRTVTWEFVGPEALLDMLSSREKGRHVETEVNPHVLHLRTPDGAYFRVSQPRDTDSGFRITRAGHTDSETEVRVREIHPPPPVRTIKRSSTTGTVSREWVEASIRAIHVFPEGDRWTVMRTGVDRIWRSFSDKENALQFAESLSDSEKREIRVHDREGNVECNSFGE